MQKRFSDEFKKSAIARVRNGETQIDVAKSLGISFKTLNRWCVKAKDEMSSGTLSLSEENARLRKALKEREAEIAFLKKISGTRLFVKGWTTIFPDYSIFKWSSQL